MSARQEMIEQLLHAQSRGDWDTMFTIMSDDAIFELAFHKTRFEGREEIVKRMAPSIARMAGLTFSEIEVRDLADPDWAIATFKGTAEVTTTGRPYHQTYIALYRFTDGKVSLFREYFDTIALAVATGMLDPPK